jgi:hypothetical protein
VKQLTRERKIVNYRLSCIRRIIEKVFDILAVRFGIFKTNINIKLDNIKDIVMASSVMHSFLRRKSPDTSTPFECFDIDDLENGIVTAGLSHSSSMATLKSGNNWNHQLTGQEGRSQLWNTSTTKGKCRSKTTVYKAVIYQEPLLLICLVHTVRILYE